MKKVVVMFTALFSAVVVNAAAFSWGGLTLSSEDVIDAGWAQEGSQFYLIALGVSDFSGDPTAPTLAGVLANLGGTTVATYTTDFADYTGGGFTQSYGADASVINQWYAVVSYDPTTGGFYGWTTFEVTNLTNISPPGDYSVDMDVSQYALVPEPTSLALLALGVAAMGLRRKVK